MSERKRFIASVQDSKLKNIESIAEALEVKGCKIDNILTFSGIITGSFNGNTSLDDLKLDGIKRVEYDRAVKAI